MLWCKTWSEESYINDSVVGALEFAGGYMDVTSFAFAHAKKKTFSLPPRDYSSIYSCKINLLSCYVPHVMAVEPYLLFLQKRHLLKRDLGCSSTLFQISSDFKP